MIIIEDTRNKEGKHKKKHEAWRAIGDLVVRSKLAVGDYSLPPRVAVDTKQDVKEVAANLCGNVRERSRFREECKLAKRMGTRLVILIEDPRLWEVSDLYGRKVYLIGSGRTISGDQVAEAMLIHEERYGVHFEFCAPEDSAERIKELLTCGS